MNLWKGFTYILQTVVRLQPILLMASIHRYGCLVCLNFLHGKKYFSTSISQATIKWHNVKSNIFPGLSTKVCNFQFETVFVLKENGKFLTRNGFGRGSRRGQECFFDSFLYAFPFALPGQCPLLIFCELHTNTYYHY